MQVISENSENNEPKMTPNGYPETGGWPNELTEEFLSRIPIEVPEKLLVECMDCLKICNNFNDHKCFGNPRGAVSDGLDIIFSELGEKGYSVQHITHLIESKLKEIKWGNSTPVFGQSVD